MMFIVNDQLLFLFPDRLVFQARSMMPFGHFDRLKNHLGNNGYLAL